MPVGRPKTACYQPGINPGTTARNGGMVWIFGMDALSASHRSVGLVWPGDLGQLPFEVIDQPAPHSRLVIGEVRKHGPNRRIVVAIDL